MITLSKRLQRAVIAEEADMETAIRQLSQLHQQYNKMGGLMTDEEFAQTILAALPPSWDALINSIQITASSAEVTGRILSEELRRAERAAVSASSTALIAKGHVKPKPKPKSKFRKGVFCHNCNKEGHIKIECRSAKAQTSGNMFGSTSHAHVVELDAKTDSYAFASNTSGPAPTTQKEI